MWIVICPYCEDNILIEEINCGIFRHGVWKETMTPIPPHTPKHQCDEWHTRGLIYGCGKPFRTVLIGEHDYKAVPCGYE